MQLPPGGASVLRRRLRDVARAAEGLQIVHVIGFAAPVEPDDVIDFEPSGPAALPAPPPVVAKHRAAHARPSASIEAIVVSTNFPFPSELDQNGLRPYT